MAFGLNGPGDDTPGGAFAQSGAESSGGSSPLPAVSLPKGGGAIQSIGERFQVNAATGAGSTQIPLPVPAGRAGFELALGLQYSTGAGNGPFGSGWALSPPSITRKTDRGLPRYTDRDDTFVLSGADDLVLVGEAPDAADGERADYRIERYRPRVERAYARIERWRHRTTNEVHFRVTDRDNVVQIFGASAGARVADPATPSRVFQWLLEEARDDRGNLARYEYKAEDGVGVDRTQPHERHRFAAGAFVARGARYLKRIQYGNRAPSIAGDWMFQVVFDYGAHDERDPRLEETPGAAWRVRPDPFSTYRAGFELRTYRLCERVLVFHHFPDEPGFGAEPQLVRAVRLGYDKSPDGRARSPHLAKLTSVTVEGVRQADDGTREQLSLPPLELDYSEPVLRDVLDVMKDAPPSVASWVDLDADGLPGALHREDGSWFYRNNRGGGELAPARRLPSQPGGSGASTQLVDLGGDGDVDLVQLGGAMSGYWARTRDGGWEDFLPLRDVPNLDFSDPNLQIVDIDGDGHADLLINEDEAFVWYRSKPKVGYERADRVPWAADEERGPRVVFTNPDEAVQLADMSGDGLQDIVRIRASEICYWPNLGYGRFGAKVTMRGAPVLASYDGFEPSRLTLGDIDGSGTTDLVYADARAARVYLNESGNAFSEERVLRSLPPLDALSTLSLVDLLGTGTACLVWSSSHPTDRARELVYVDLLGGAKPHLLIAQRNNLGAETRVRYAPSTRFALEDRAAGRPWLTRLPFPVHVVERVEHYDGPRDARFVTEYRYRHGYFDPHERELRGFGYVEQRDAESFSLARGKGLFEIEADNEDARFHRPPVVTKRWFHTGAWLRRQRLERGYAQEYFDDPLVAPLPDTRLTSVRQSAEDERQLVRALAGTALRTEVYAEDGDPAEAVPYAVTEQNQQLRLLQPSSGDRPAVVAVDPGDTLQLHYERRRDDPRITHTVTLAVDDFGNVRRAAQVAYPRRAASREVADNAASVEQAGLWATVTEADFVNRDDALEWHRVGVPYETRTWELRGLPSSEGRLLTAGVIEEVLAFATDVNHPEPRVGAAERRLVARRQTVYVDDGQRAPLPLGVIESLALPFETYDLVWKTSELDAVLPGLSDTERASTLTARGGYLLRDDAVWRPSGRVHFDADMFYLPHRLTDPFGQTSSVEYDRHALLVVTAEDALANRSVVTPDYRALFAARVLDANDNETAVRFDALGRVVAIAVMGTDGEGDSLDDPSARFSYHLDEWRAHRLPAYARTEARETHRDPGARWHTSYEYSGGSGKTLLTKSSAEPGPAYAVRDGEVVFDAATAPRWIASGRVVLDNKGDPVKQYEPYFVRSPSYEPESALLEVGVTAVLHYDPLGRLVETELPDGTSTRVTFDAWTRTEHDGNDLVLGSPWEARMRALADAEERPAPTLDKPHAHARAMAAKLSQSPTTVHLDALGRDVATAADNRERDIAGELVAPTDPDSGRAILVSRVVLDVAGNTLAMLDPRGQRRRAAGVSADVRTDCARQRFDRLGRRWALDSVDAGVHETLLDALDQPIRSRTANGVIRETRYDALRRPSAVLVETSAGPVQIQRLVYGESHPEARARNLRGQLFRVYDGAGVLTHERYDFKGALETRTRRLPVAHRPVDAGDDTFESELHQCVDWSAMPPLVRTADAPERDPLAADALPAEVAAILGERLIETIEHDALGRPIVEILHDGSVLRPTYNEAGLLESLDLHLDDGTTTNVITNIDYNARGQRIRVDYSGDNVVTRLTYDPLTFRLESLRTVRTSDGVALQRFSYTYDAAGNVTSILDHAPHDHVPGHDLASPHRTFEHDGLGQLIEATGRAIPRPGPNAGDDPRDAGGLRRYTERYEYDPAGNLRLRAHRVDVAPGLRQGFTQRFEVEAGQLPARGDVFSNRLVATESTAHPAAGADTMARSEYRHDAAGNLLNLGLTAALAWTPDHRLGALRRTSLKAAYAYDAAGERVRKVVETAGPVRRERIYFGYYEVYREWHGSELRVQRSTLNITDGARRVLLVERGASGPPRLRFQLGDHLDTVGLEVDPAGGVITHEEYLPYGETALFLAFRDVSRKRYRYTGKEHDEESGLHYHSARYLAPWLGRWCSADPAEFVDGPNLFAYVRGRVVGAQDPSGLSVQSVLYRPAYDGIAPARGTPIGREHVNTILLEQDLQFEILAEAAWRSAAILSHTANLEAAGAVVDWQEAQQIADAYLARGRAEANAIYFTQDGTLRVDDLYVVERLAGSPRSALGGTVYERLMYMAESEREVLFGYWQINPEVEDAYFGKDSDVLGACPRDDRCWTRPPSGRFDMGGVMTPAHEISHGYRRAAGMEETHDRHVPNPGSRPDNAVDYEGHVYVQWGAGRDTYRHSDGSSYRLPVSQHDRHMEGPVSTGFPQQ